MQLEHATIPPYLTALYSIHPGTNSDAYHVLRVTAVEEMLHLTLVANVLNAIGGTPDLTQPDFVPGLPGLPARRRGPTSRSAARRFSREALDTFLRSSGPRQAPDEASRLDRAAPQAQPPRCQPTIEPSMRFYSIGEFYKEIERGLRHLHNPSRRRRALLRRSRPAGAPEYFYSGGGELDPGHRPASAKEAIELIAEQGEGFGGHVYDAEHELAHYYRFEQLTRSLLPERRSAGEPTGPELEVDWDAVFPIKTDARLADYPPDSECAPQPLSSTAAMPTSWSSSPAPTTDDRRC